MCVCVVDYFSVCWLLVPNGKRFRYCCCRTNTHAPRSPTQINLAIHILLALLVVSVCPKVAFQTEPLLMCLAPSFFFSLMLPYYPFLFLSFRVLHLPPPSSGLFLVFCQTRSLECSLPLCHRSCFVKALTHQLKATV